VTPVVPPYRRGGGFGSLGIRFHEVFQPARVPLRPETLGAWLTLAALAVALCVGIWIAVRRYVRGAYRRAAAHELATLAARFEQQSQDLAALEALPNVLKRCALGSFERSKVAPLHGARWVEFLSATSPRPFGEDAGRALVTLATRGASALTRDEAVLLFAAAREWIRRHRADL